MEYRNVIPDGWLFVPEHSWKWHKGYTDESRIHPKASKPAVDCIPGTGDPIFPGTTEHPGEYLGKHPSSMKNTGNDPLPSLPGWRPQPPSESGNAFRFQPESHKSALLIRHSPERMLKNQEDNPGKPQNDRPHPCLQAQPRGYFCRRHHPE